VQRQSRWRCGCPRWGCQEAGQAHGCTAGGAPLRRHAVASNVQICARTCAAVYHAIWQNGLCLNDVYSAGPAAVLVYASLFQNQVDEYIQLLEVLTTGSKGVTALELNLRTRISYMTVLQLLAVCIRTFKPPCGCSLSQTRSTHDQPTHRAHTSLTKCTQYQYTSRLHAALPAPRAADCC
jgi:hypothetical protein